MTGPWGVVLAAGVGRRMRAASTSGTLGDHQRRAAERGHKAMMPMASTGDPRPFLDYVLSALAEAGLAKVVLVVGPSHEEVAARYLGRTAGGQMSIELAVQEHPTGTAHAVLAAALPIGSRDFLVVNGDNLYPVEVLRALVHLPGPGVAVFERDALVRSSHLLVDRVAAFALLDVSEDGLLVDVHEKPARSAVEAAGPRAGVGMNAWRFDARIFEACRDVEPSPRGEYELTAAVRLAMSRGVTFRAVPAEGPVLDVSTRDDVEAVSARLASVVPRW